MTGSFNADDAGEFIEGAAHAAHSIACNLQLLLTACAARADTWMHLNAEAFADGMRELSASTVELADQLDQMSLLSDGTVRSQVNEFWRIATRLSGLLRLMSDAACESDLQDLEVAPQSLVGSLEHWAGRMQRIEEMLGGIRALTGQRVGGHCRAV